MDKEDKKVVAFAFPPPTQPGNSGGNGGNYSHLSERLTRLETEFKEVVKKSDLQDQTNRLEKSIRDEAAKARSEVTKTWIQGIIAVATILTLILVAMNFFSN